MFTFTKAKRGDTSQSIHSGEAVTLLPYNSIDVIINCANSKLCRVDHTCTNNTGPYIFCDRQIWTIFVPGKKKGDSIVDEDLIKLRRTIPEHNNILLGCDVNNTRKCKHFDCDSNDCSEESFILHIL